MIRRSITRACLISLLTVAPASQVSALQLSPVDKADSPGESRVPEAAALTLARSILEPIPAKVSGRKVESAKHVANKAGKTKVKPNSISAIAGTSLFAQLDSIVAASMPEVGESTSEDPVDSKTADYQSNADEATNLRIEQTSAQLPARQASTTLSPGAAETAILIHPPQTRASAPNRHFFQIENTSRHVARNVVVELAVPYNAHIIEVAPYETVVVDNTARYRFPSIAAGESKMIELTTNPGMKDEVVFESRFSMEHVRHLAARSAPHKVDVWSPEEKPEPAPSEPEETRREEPRKVPARTIATKPEMNVLSGRTARKQWEQQAKLNYGPTGIPGRVMVANPQATSMEKPIAKAPESFAPSTDIQLEVALERSQPQPVEKQIVEASPEVASDDLSPSVSASSTEPGSGWFQSQLKTKIDGPQHAVTGEEAEYQVLVENASADDVKDVLVQLAIPTGLEVTVLDRDAWFDGDARTITWRLSEVTAGSKETIRYLAKVVSADGQLQKVTIGAANQFRGQAIFQSTVMDQYELAAPLLPFEKDRNSLK